MCSAANRLSFLLLRFLLLHLGRDDHHREGTTPEGTRSEFADLIQRLERDEYVRELDLLFCGPNISWRLHGSLYSCPSHHSAAEEGERLSTATNPANDHGDDRDGEGQHQSSGDPPSSSATGVLEVKFRYNSGLYHDVSGLFPAPDALFLFNAGLWGYDDWEPTLEHILGCNSSCGDGAACDGRCGGGDGDADRPPVVVTSYCPEEASDDMETILRVLLGDETEGGSPQRENAAVVGGLEWLWKPEENPHRSLVPRQTHCGVEGRVLFENQSWQAVRRRSRGRGRSIPPRAAIAIES